jgi:hexosaminidase
VLAAYPELGNTNERFDVWNHWGISEHVLNVNEEALRFAEEVVRSVASHFPGSPVHIGGDECPSTEWANSPAARAVMREHGFTDPQQLQGLYTARLSKVLREDGHEVLAWDEVLDAEVPPGTTIVAWRSEEKGIEAARRGYDTIMAPENVFYFDVLSDSTPGEPVAISPLPRVTTWRNVYQHAIIPSQMTTSEARHVRGAQVQLWTEYIATTEHLYYMAFPRLCAFAEVVWGTAGDVDKFAERLAIHVERLAARSVPFRPLS